eukprot:95699-Rhodomonas_salina.3
MGVPTTPIPRISTVMVGHFPNRVYIETQPAITGTVTRPGCSSRSRSPGPGVGLCQQRTRMYKTRDLANTNDHARQIGTARREDSRRNPNQLRPTVQFQNCQLLYLTTKSPAVNSENKSQAEIGNAPLSLPPSSRSKSDPSVQHSINRALQQGFCGVKVLAARIRWNPKRDVVRFLHHEDCCYSFRSMDT